MGRKAGLVSSTDSHGCSENNERKSTYTNTTRRKACGGLLDYMSLCKPRKTLMPRTGAMDLVPKGSFTHLLQPCMQGSRRIDKGLNLGASVHTVLNTGRSRGSLSYLGGGMLPQRTVHHKTPPCALNLSSLKPQHPLRRRKSSLGRQRVQVAASRLRVGPAQGRL